MRLPYILLALLLGYFQSFSQDQIVTISGDTISGNVLDVDQFVVTYRSGENQEANQTIEIYNVDTILRFVPKEMKKAKHRKSYLSSSKSNKMRGPRVFAGAGYGYVTGAVKGNEFVQNYAKGLRHGVVGNGGITYFFGRYFGLGISYTYFHSENSLDFVVGQSSLTREWGYSHTYDRIHVNTISLNPTARFPFLNGIIMLNPGIAVGYKFWKDKTFFIEPFIISAS